MVASYDTNILNHSFNVHRYKGTGTTTTVDPFSDNEKHILLGVANIITQCLYHHICYEYDAPIIGPTGKVTMPYSLLTS